MTPQEQVVAYVKSQIGYYATAAKRNKYAQALDAMGFIYNGAKNGYDWCDVFADHAYIHCFGAETALKMINQPKYGCGAGCSYSAAYYRAAGQWSDSPQLAAQIFFGKRGDEGHTGIVVGYDSTFVYTVEGNVGGGGGMVGARTHRRSDSNIAGYGIPKWSLVGGSSSPSKPAADTYDPNSKLEIDGIFGTLTAKKLQYQLKQKGYYTEAYMAKLGYNGIDCWIDGDFAFYTKLALQGYLKAKQYYKGYNIDGDFVYYSVLGLQKYLKKLGYYTQEFMAKLGYQGIDCWLDADWGKFTTIALQAAMNDGKF